MGQPAARVGDTTAHGGAIIAGAPTVNIDKMPAARISDMHTCPMSTPGTPPVPHIGGPISKGSTGVFICGLPAARVGDMAVCTGPPDSIVKGSTTVFIGETKPGGGGGGGGGSAQATAASVGAVMSAAMAGTEPEPQQPENHFLHVNFIDSAGKPLSGLHYTVTGPQDMKMGGVLSHKIKRLGIPQGQYEITLKAITAAYWSHREADENTNVEMIVEAVGFEDGTPVTIQVWERSINWPDRVIQTIDDLTLNNGQLRHTWDPPFGDDDDEDDEMVEGYRAPSFFFSVNVRGIKERSGVLVYKDWIEIALYDADGNPVSDQWVKIVLSTGEICNEKLDKSGEKKIEKVLPGKYRISFSHK